MDKTIALIVAAGRGVRVGGALPKQYCLIGGRPILRRTLDAFLAHPSIDRSLVVIADGDDRYDNIAPHNDRLLPPATGGKTRQESVRAGLQALSDHRPRHVLIHDAARPFVSADLIHRVIEALADADAVVPALPVPATLKTVDASSFVTGTLDRRGVQAAETPQGFRFTPILAAHEQAALASLTFTDDAGVAEWAGMPVKVVPGEPANLKLTTAADIAAADRKLVAEAVLAQGDVRVGTGYDVHAYGPGNELMLGGVAIRHTRGVVGHSDGDVALHALTDAVLGALADGDIGHHFPPSDQQWKGASSDQFLAFAAGRVAARGGSIAHLDLVIIAEAPRIGEHRNMIRARIAAICGITADRVGVKATTNENLGFIGRGEGLAAYATATIRLPFGGAA
jgi:2-C-methyl-D-erythritol 4-phosphate cytidylyltransferase / 2-C-methyl-D-erythritol 2,4-cyclodiphosphate synthase